MNKINNLLGWKVFPNDDKDNMYVIQGNIKNLTSDEIKLLQLPATTVIKPRSEFYTLNERNDRISIPGIRYISPVPSRSEAPSSHIVHSENNVKSDESRRGLRNPPAIFFVGS